MTKRKCPLTGRVQRKKRKISYKNKKQSNRVQHFLSILDENYFVSNKFGSEIYVRDFKTLISGNWLNDEIINFWMKYLMHSFVDVYCFSVQFFIRYRSSGYVGVRRWTSGINLFNKRLLLIPIIQPGHWTLAVVDFNVKTISYYDSRLGRNQECLNIVLEYLKSEFQDKNNGVFEAEGWSLVHQIRIPIQSNGFDCGPFICRYSECLCRGEEFDFDEVDLFMVLIYLI